MHTMHCIPTHLFLAIDARPRTVDALYLAAPRSEHVSVTISAGAARRYARLRGESGGFVGYAAAALLRGVGACNVRVHAGKRRVLYKFIES